MAKFRYRMQNILDIKEKMENQAKTAYGMANAKLAAEQQKLQDILIRRAGYESKARELVSGSINVLEIRECRKAIDVLKSKQRSQMMNVHAAERDVELARKQLNEAMVERKTHEKLKEKAFEEFKQELLHEESKEIAGDAILWLWEHRETLQVETSLGRYLLKSVYHRSLNCIKQKQLKNHADTMYYEEMEKLIHDAETYQFQELSKRVKEAIDALPTSYREAFVMHRFTKKSYKEIAESSGVSVKTIAYRIQQATKLLRKDLADLLITMIVCVLSVVR